MLRFRRYRALRKSTCVLARNRCTLTGFLAVVEGEAAVPLGKGMGMPVSILKVGCSVNANGHFVQTCGRSRSRAASSPRCIFPPFVE